MYFGKVSTPLAFRRSCFLQLLQIIANLISSFLRMSAQLGGRNVTVSPLEQKLIAECKNEALWKRSIPLAFGGGAYVLLALNRGHIKSITKLSRWPKILVKGTLTIAGIVKTLSEREG